MALRVEGLTAAAYELRHLRVDLERSNIAAVWEAMPSVSLVELVPVGGAAR